MHTLEAKSKLLGGEFGDILLSTRMIAIVQLLPDHKRGILHKILKIDVSNSNTIILERNLLDRAVFARIIVHRQFTASISRGILSFQGSMLQVRN